jgi:DNA-binding NarL/FixJ family response regulator
MNQEQVQQSFKALIISAGATVTTDILACLADFPTFAGPTVSSNAVTGLQAIAAERPDLVLVVAPLPDRMLRHVLAEARKRHAGIRIVVVANWTEFAGHARASQKRADGFISTRLLHRELPLVLAQFPLLAEHWGARFSPWKVSHGLA